MFDSYFAAFRKGSGYIFPPYCWAAKDQGSQQRLIKFFYLFVISLAPVEEHNSNPALETLSLFTVLKYTLM